MNIFKRSKSIASKSNDRPPDVISTPAPSSSSKAPTVPQMNIVFNPSGLLTGGDLSSSDRSLANGSGKRLTSNKASYRDVDESKSFPSIPYHSSSLASPSRVPPRSMPKAEYKIDHDMYTQNDLSTFSFGAALSTHPSSSSSLLVDPLFRPRDEADSDEGVLIPDTTPRPSVVGSVPHRTHPSHSSRQDDWPSPSRHKHPDRGKRVTEKSREPDSDTTSTFGTSSASASVSSLPRPRGKSSRGTSQISGRSSETPQTSANDLTSDEELDGRHPFPPGALESRPRAFRNREQESSLYLSEEDFENYNDDFDRDGTEIDPVGNIVVGQGAYFDYGNLNRSNPRVAQFERRGSLARDIPNAQTDRSNYPRDNYMRRPSRSLEELSTFSFTNNTGSSHGGHKVGDRSVPTAPTSVPESGGNWGDFRKKSIQRDKELPPIFNPTVTLSPSVASSSNSNMNSTTVIASNSSSSNDLQFQWMQSYGVNGVITFDPSEMSDIVGEGDNNERRESYSAFRKGSNATFRRQSTVSSVDIFNKRIVVWGGKTFIGQRPMWTFTQEKDLPTEDSNSRQGDGSKARSSVSTLFSSRPSTSTGAELSLTGSRTFFDKSDSKGKEKSGKEKASGKDKASKEPWRGMALDSEEIWCNGAIGRFKVSRKNAISNEPGKPPQQRLNINFLRTSYTHNATQSDQYLDGPTITIHKHSKAGAFSIARHYRSKPPAEPNATTVSLRTGSAVGASTETDGRRKKSSNTMILLGSRRVQYAYTSTNTTRKLESHGLLDESGRTSPRDVERMRREYEREERARVKEKEKKDKGKEKEKDRAKETEKERSKRKLAESSSSKSFGGKDDTKSKPTQPLDYPLPDSSEGSAGSVSYGLSSGSDSIALTNNGTPITTPDASEGASSMNSMRSGYPQSSVPSIMSYETVSSDRTITRTAHRSHPRKRGVYDIDHDIDDEEDSSDERPRYPTRTPHREAYASLPPEVFEAAHQEHPSHGLFGWGKTRSGDRSGNRGVNSYLEQSYNPPWPTTLPRPNSETRKFIVDDLNTSFQDVGLLPAIGEIKGSSHSQQKRRHNREHKPPKPAKRSSGQTHPDIFEEYPPDALCMLLPLWPGETDPVSARIHPFTPTAIPIHERQYLLVYYKTFEDPSKTKSAEKKRSRDSPSNSGDHDRNVLLSAFHISARIVAYRDFQGSGVRIPDLGLAVSGRLEDAYATMPSVPTVGDYVMGFCHSRENGIEFISEGFDKLGLATHIPNPAAAKHSEDDEDNHSSDSLTVLTPIGRAVMEMVWLGGMALTSFNPNL